MLVAVECINTPMPPLLEIIFLAPVVSPPIVLREAAFEIETPAPSFARPLAPVTSVPMKLPKTTLSVVALSAMRTPETLLPEMMLRAPSDTPPIVLFEAPDDITTPEPMFPRSDEPVTSVPMKFL